MIIIKAFRLFGKVIKWVFTPIVDYILGTSKKIEELGYTASFGDVSDITKRKHRGFCLGGKRSLSLKQSFEGVLVIGPPGSGKSSTVFLPTLLRAKNSSLIIHDPSGELYQKSAGYLESQGYTLQVLNFADAKYSDGYNPLSRAKTSQEINKVATMVISTALGSGKSDPFWNLQAVALLRLAITVIKETSIDSHLHKVKELLHQISHAPKEVEDVIVGINSPVLFRDWKTYQGYDTKIKAGVVASCMSALQIFADETVALVTSFDSVSTQLLRLRKTALFIQNSVADSRYFTVLTSLFFEQVLGELVQRLPREDELDVLILIDEAATLNVPSLDQMMTNVRKYRTGVMLGVQDFQQLVERYGQAAAETIRSSCYAQMFFSGIGPGGASDISRLLGTTQTTTSDGRSLVHPLLSPDQVRMLSPQKAIIIAGHHRPVQTKLIPYYKQKRLQKRSKLPLPYRYQKRPTLSLN